MKEVKKGVPLPEEYEEFSEGLIYFKSEYKGKTYINLRKTYVVENERFLGKGLTIQPDQFSDLVVFINNLKENE